MILEVCIDSVASAIAAQEGGAQRVELCADLASGGTTPSAGMIRSVREAISIALHVMVRPRPGDFCYSEIEYHIMLQDIKVARELGADGVVFGILTPHGSVDIERVRTLVQNARPLAVTFHRAVDHCSDLTGAIKILKEVGVDRVLTSGGKPNVSDGIESLRAMVQAAGPSLQIMAGGGLTVENARNVVMKTGVKEIHALSGASSTVIPSGQPRYPDAVRTVADPEKIRLLLRQVHQP